VEILGKRWQATGKRGRSRTCHAHVEFEDGTRSEFRVPPAVYDRFADGDAGVVHVKGEWILAFERSFRDGQRNRK
jgi:hypothetical protein